MSCGGNISSNPAGGHNVNLHGAVKAGDANGGIAAGVFASGTTNGGPATTGVFATATANGHSLSVQNAKTHGVGHTTSAAASMNLFQNDQHVVNATVSHARTNLANSLKFDKVGGNIDWNHAQGHAASVGVVHVPKFDMKILEASAKTNLWTSNDKATTFDATINAQRHLSGPFASKDNLSGFVGLNHKF